jgi:hypothetical protein
MIPDHEAQRLHIRSSRGERLTPEEQAQLDGWYARLDAAERVSLAAGVSDEVLAEERARLAALVRETQAVAKQIEQQMAENEALRREVRRLEELFAQRRTAQPA